MTTLLIATRNKHKLSEIRAILEPACRCLAIEDPNAPVVDEDAATFAGNATKKSVMLARHVASSRRAEYLSQNPKSVFVLADDSGLEVDALSGAPGVHSARFAALDSKHTTNSSDTANNQKLLRLLRHIPPEKRTGRFRCVIALTPTMPLSPAVASPVCYADEIEWQVELFEGTCEGQIIFTPRGSAGFGYDPLFVPDGHDRTFAELGEEEKNRLSHRAKALEKLKQTFEQIRPSR